MLTTERLLLTPLRVEDAEEMVDVLGDERLYEFIGEHPPTIDELRTRYRRLITGSLSEDEQWLNWIVRERPEGTAVGTVQASLTFGTHPVAMVAWVIGVPWQRRGFATEAAKALVDWLRGKGIERISATIHSDHHASQGVARQVGLKTTDELVDGEAVWRLL